jgi:hypothetical protein
VGDGANKRKLISLHMQTDPQAGMPTTYHTNRDCLPNSPIRVRRRDHPAPNVHLSLHTK